MQGDPNTNVRFCYQCKVGSSCTDSLLLDATAQHKGKNLFHVFWAHAETHLFSDRLVANQWRGRKKESSTDEEYK